MGVGRSGHRSAAVAAQVRLLREQLAAGLHHFHRARRPGGIPDLWTLVISFFSAETFKLTRTAVFVNTKTSSNWVKLGQKPFSNGVTFETQ